MGLGTALAVVFLMRAQAYIRALHKAKLGPTSTLHMPSTVLHQF
jgi:hypothetical protein